MHIIKKILWNVRGWKQSIKSGCESFSGRFGCFGSLLSAGSRKRDSFPPKHTRHLFVHCPDWSLFNPSLPMSAELSVQTNAAANPRNSTRSCAGAAGSHDHGRNNEVRQRQPRPEWQRDVNNSLILRFFTLTFLPDFFSSTRGENIRNWVGLKTLRWLPATLQSFCSLNKTHKNYFEFLSWFTWLTEAKSSRKLYLRSGEWKLANVSLANAS